MTFGIGHHRGIGQAKIKVGELCVDLDGPAKKAWRKIGHVMLTGIQRRRKQAGGMRANPRSQQLIDLDDHRTRHDEITTQPGHKLGRESMGLVTPVDGGNQRPGVRDNSQLTETNSVR